jgi:hypothetical protein
MSTFIRSERRIEFFLEGSSLVLESKANIVKSIVSQVSTGSANFVLVNIVSPLGQHAERFLGLVMSALTEHDN